MTMVLILNTLFVSAQPVQTIRGKVMDRDTKSLLPGANILLLNTDPLIGTSTEEDGSFRLEKVKIGRYDVKVTFLGYEDIVIYNVIVGSGKEIILTIEMFESIVSMKAVEIVGNGHKSETINQMASVSARSFTVDETKRYAGSFNDPARMAMGYAGVTPNFFGSNDIVIRGNSPQGLLWRLEDVDIPNPNHFGGEGSTGGPISMLNSTTLSNSDFFTGAFPAEYGNAFSGVFDVKMRNGNNEKREYTLQMGLIGVEAGAEGPIGQSNGSSYLVNYRYSTLELLNKLGVKVVGDAIPEFQDLSFKVNIPSRKLGVINLFGIGGLSKIHFDEKNDEEVNYGYSDYTRDMAAIGISQSLPLSDKIYLRSVIAWAGTRNTYDEYVNHHSKDFYLYDRDRFINHNVCASSVVNYKANSHHFLKTGIRYKHLSFDMLSKHYDERKEALVTSLEDQGNSYSIQVFAGDRYRISDTWTLNGGIHFLYFGLNRHYSIEPRLGLRWDFAPAQAVTAGFGIHSRMESVSTYMAWTDLPGAGNFRLNNNLDFIRARHYVLGYENRLSEDLFLKAEIYFQDLFNVPIEPGDSSVYSILNQFDWYTRKQLVNEGNGYNYGIELSLEKYFSKNYYFLITGSLFNSKFQAGDGKWRNTVYNGNYVFNVLAGKEFRLGKASKNRTLMVSTKASWAGGHWYTPVDLDESRERGYTVLDESSYLSIQARDYFRLDIKAAVRRERPKSTHVIEMDIQNVTNTQNTAGVYYDVAEDRADEWTSTGIIPTLNYRIEF